ncbi:spore coat protein, CotS family [Clostridium novyi A str. 4552]|uniref:Spore coat protein, CotS family n=1 Tax=Clostridium novyi A str. 4552 TaxID=1444289 RepID=A0A0A0IBJ3_CLONO|nr:CotS family spore coat protein [Clostridium novyi]KGM97898.1 spore coat protein, CotS family [Clostridium novyi A str. 4552]
MADTAKLYNTSIFSEENMKKSVLPYYNLDNAEVTAIKFKDTAKQRAVYRITTDKKEYCLKKVYFGKKELLFVYSAIEWLYRHDINIPRLLPNSSCGRFVEYNNMLFILTPWIDGVKCEYNYEEHITKSCSNLAKIHKRSFDFFPIAGSTYRKGCGNLYKSMSKHFDNLLLNSNYAFKYRDYFSKSFLNKFNEGIILAKNSTEALSRVNFSNLKTSLCHMDYVNKNLIFDKDDNLWIIDLDKCRIDYCIHDLAYFFRRLLRRYETNWDLDILLLCLDSYEKILPLNVDEYNYLLGYLSFPQKYWKLSRDYYKNIKKCNKKAFVNMLSKASRDFDKQIMFSNKFSDYINKKFN